MKTYRIERHDYDGFSTSYGGGFTEAEVKEIVKGYKLDTDLSIKGFQDWYSRKNGTRLFCVTEE